MANLAQLLIALAGEGMKRYEAKTGLNGIGNILMPVIQENAQHYVGGVNLDPSAARLGIEAFKVFDAYRQGKQQQQPIEQTPVEQPIVQQVVPNVPKHIKGAPVPGYVGRTGRR